MEKLKELTIEEWAIKLDRLTTIILKNLDVTLIDGALRGEFSKTNWWINKMAKGEYKHPKAYLFNQAFEQCQRMIDAKNEAIRLLKFVEMFPKEDEAV